MQRDWLNRLLFHEKISDLNGVSGWVLRPVRFLYLVGKEFHSDLCFERAASLTFATILSLIPLSVLFFSFANVIGAGSEIESYATERIFPLLAPEFQDDLNKWLETLGAKLKAFQDSLSGLVGFVALITLVIAALGVILTAERNFNRIWKSRHSRSYLQKFSVFWVILTISPFVLIASTKVGDYLVPANSVMEELTRNYAPLRLVYDFLVPVSFGLLGFTVLYLFLPCAKVQMRSAVLGAVVAAVLWEGSKRGFTFYVQRTSTLYGQLAIVPLFLVWVYLNWLITLFGAVMCYVHQNLRLFNALGYSVDPTSEVPQAFVGTFLMEKVARSFQCGRSFPSAASVAKDLGVRVERVEDTARYLIQGGLLAETAEPEGGYALMRAPEEIPLRQVIELLPQEDFPDELLELTRKAFRVGACAAVGRELVRAFQEARHGYLESFGSRTLAQVISSETGVEPPAPPPPASEPASAVEAPPT